MKYLRLILLPQHIMLTGNTSSLSRVPPTLQQTTARQPRPPCVACSSGCWWQWDLPDGGQARHWTLLMQGAEPCTGFQIMQSSTVSAQTMDITHMAVPLPDLSRQSLKQKMHESFRGDEATEGMQTWLVRTSASGLIKLWLDGAGSSNPVEATAEVRTAMIAARLVIKGNCCFFWICTASCVVSM